MQFTRSSLVHPETKAPLLRGEFEGTWDGLLYGGFLCKKGTSRLYPVVGVDMDEREAVIQIYAQASGPVFEKFLLDDNDPSDWYFYKVRDDEGPSPTLYDRLLNEDE